MTSEFLSPLLKYGIQLNCVCLHLYSDTPRSLITIHVRCYPKMGHYLLINVDARSLYSSRSNIVRFIKQQRNQKLDQYLTHCFIPVLCSSSLPHFYFGFLNSVLLVFVDPAKFCWLLTHSVAFLSHVHDTNYGLKCRFVWRHRTVNSLLFVVISQSIIVGSAL
jgi:hypothetical protein